jgi:hypothetical protein
VIGIGWRMQNGHDGPEVRGRRYGGCMGTANHGYNA